MTWNESLQSVPPVVAYYTCATLEPDYTSIRILQKWIYNSTRLIHSYYNPTRYLAMAFAAARILKDKKDQQEQKLIKSPECINVNRTGKKVYLVYQLLYVLCT